jgi:hypothetical protein
MALRQAGQGAARLLLLSVRHGAAPLLPGAAQLSGLHTLALHAAALQLPRRAGGGRAPPPLPFGVLGLQPQWGVALRGLQVASDKKEEKALPDAAECDVAIEKYREVRGLAFAAA